MTVETCTDCTITVREFPNESAALAYAVEQWRANGCERFTVFVED